MRKITCLNRFHFWSLLFLMLIGVGLQSYSQCPIVTDPLQSFCNTQNPLISDLVAIDNGGGVEWYATAISTTPLPSSTPLINGMDYFAGDTIGVCVGRPGVHVIIVGPPMGLNFQGVCVDDPNDARISDLMAIGTDVKWYNVPNGGTPLSPNTILIGNTIYYADQANPLTGCRTSRLSVFVNVGVVPVPTGDAVQEFCSGLQPPPTVADLVASDNNNWYSTPASATPLDPSTPLVDGNRYYATTVADPPCESIGRFEVLVVFTASNDSGDNGIIDICETDAATIQTVNLFDALGGTPGNDGIWTGPFSTNNGSMGNVDVTAMTVAGSPYIFTYTVSSSTECAPSSSTVSIFIADGPNAGLDGILEFCEDEGPIDLFTVLGGTPDLGGIWSPALASGTGVFDPALDPPTTYTYTVTGNPPCADVSANVIVTVVPIPDAGLDGTLDLCSDDVPVDLFTVLGGTPDPGGTWSPALASGTGVFDPAFDPPGIYTYIVTSTSSCGDDSARVRVTLTPAPNAGLRSILDVCDDVDPIDLFTVLGGTPDPDGTWNPSLASGIGIFDPRLDAPGIYTYTVAGISSCDDDSATVTITVFPSPDAGLDANFEFCGSDSPVDLFTILDGTPDLGGVWSPALASGTGVFDPTLDPPDIYTYTVAGSPPCIDDSATVTVTVATPPNAGIDGTLNLCGNDTPVDLFTVLGGNPDPGGSWSPSLISGTGVFDPGLDPSGIYTYTITGIPPCANDIATGTVTVIPAPDAGLDSPLDLCDSGGPVDLFTILGGTPDAGGAWNPALSSGTGVFDPALDSSGLYTYTVSGILPCGNDSATVTVNLVLAPDAGLDGTLDFCASDGPVNLFTVLGGTPDLGGNWSPVLLSGTGVFDPTIDPPGTYTYTVSGTIPCIDDSATVIVTVVPAPDAGLDGTLDLCASDGPVDLFDVLGGTPELGGTWSPALASGTGVFDPALDSSGTYTYTVVGTPLCGGTDSAAVTVTVILAPDAGFDSTLNLCTSDGPVDLFTVLGGSPDLGGTWNPSLASGTGVFDPALDSSGIYTYTVTSSSSCGDDSSTVTVTVATAPDAGIDGALDLCNNDTPVDLFTILGGSPNLGGTWSPALASGTAVFDPVLDPSGPYTYTVSGTPPCAGAESAIVTVTVAPAPDAGLDGSLDLCVSDTPVDLFTVLGGSPDFGGIWSPALASGSGVFDPDLDSSGIYTYTVSGTPSCDDSSATVTVTVASEPNAGFDSTLDFCSDDSPIDLFTVLGGTPDSGGIWSPSLTSGTGVFDPAFDAPGVYTYTVVGIPPCGGGDTANVTVAVMSAPNAGLDGTLDLCGNDAPVDLFTVLGGTPDSGGTWSPALASGTGVFDPVLDTPRVYIYTVTGISPCGDQSSTVTVAVVPSPDAGFDGTLDLCSDDSPANLFTVLGGTPDSGGSWSPALASGTGVFDPMLDAPGDYTYTVNGISPCIGNDNSTMTVNVIPAPDVAGAVMSTTDPICLNSSNDVEITGSVFLTDGLYNITYELTGANSFVNSIDVTFTNGDASFTLPASQLGNIGQTTVTIIDLFVIGNNCGADVSPIAPVQFLIESGTTPELISEGNIFCIADNPSIADLTTNIIDLTPIVWYDAPMNGNPYPDTTPLVDGETYYGSTTSDANCESDIRLEVTVSVIDCNPQLIIPDGFSPNGDGINDTFVIKNLKELYPNFTLEIYNRYGNVLYKTNGNRPDWDGTSNIGIQTGNSELPVGVYFFILNFNKDGKDAVQGRVYLSR